MVRTVIPVVLTIVLITIGLLHFIWVFTPWPMKDAMTFTKTIGGSDDGRMPSAPSTVLVGLALIGGAVLTLMVNESIPAIGPNWLQLTGMYGLTAVLLARGLGGILHELRSRRRIPAVEHGPVLTAVCGARLHGRHCRCSRKQALTSGPHARGAVRAYREPLLYTATGALMAGWCW